ncbi:MAG: hypothetical protein ACD_19C00367G0005 [uncultured bacterium]|uniref:Uncharacterized protein n=1 Tax=Candidatus Woesebacteria bacterium RIFCSPLOWO2_01_FULL_39_21 TaxID=1802519 RepID=A0A1F8BFM6_9BACT|nr:MAG: hypothetical protein ACD_19C00367G0005 [uncultured bacterium]OGM62813.1 MAG: hypothetical protein A2961_03725 [Candidatus Woesebacteria bacterium RIFCSPLOWO2_01_FULL_39_21]
MVKKPLIFFGRTVLATLSMLIVYLVFVSLVSGWNFTKDQFAKFWYFVVALAIGFGIQVGLYSYLRSMDKNVSTKVVATSGTSSTVAMVSCCAHYLVNVLPVLGTIGVVTLISQYQVQLFWVGLLFNFAGLVYMVSQVKRYSKT